MVLFFTGGVKLARTVIGVYKSIDWLEATVRQTEFEELSRMKQLRINRIVGNAARDSVAERLRISGYNDVRIEVSYKTPYGIRRIDVQFKSEDKLYGIEVKSGGSRYSSIQRTKDEYLASDKGPFERIDLERIQ